MIEESERAIAAFNNKYPGLKSQKTLPPRQRKMLLKIFDSISNCVFDNQCLNQDWKTAISVDERSFLKKFFKTSGPQFQHLTDVWLEDFCCKLKAKTLDVNEVIKHRNRDPNIVYFIVTGKISVYDPCWNSEEVVLSNDYLPG